MNICFVNMPAEHYSPSSGGAISTIIMQSTKELLAQGHAVTVLTITNSEPIYPVGRVVPIQSAIKNNLSVSQRIGTRIWSRFQSWDWPYYEHYLSSVLRRIKALRPSPDAIVMFNDLVAPKYIKRAVASADLYVWLQNEQGTRQTSITETVRATRRFLTCSAYIRDWTSRRYGIESSQFAVIPSGVDLDEFRPAQEGEKQGGPVRCLFVGRIDPNKGPDIAADAVAAMRAEGHDVNVRVAGGTWFYRRGDDNADPYFRKLMEKIERAGGEYVGHVPRPDVPGLVREHDIAFVLSRSNEPFGLVVLEAMASGCAVIASNRGGLPEACGDAGIMVNPDDFGAVCDALRNLVVDHALLQQQKRKSLERAARSPWSATGGLLEEVLVEGSRAGSGVDKDGVSA